MGRNNESAPTSRQPLSGTANDQIARVMCFIENTVEICFKWNLKNFVNNCYDINQFILYFIRWTTIIFSSSAKWSVVI